MSVTDESRKAIRSKAPTIAEARHTAGKQSWKQTSGLSRSWMNRKLQSRKRKRRAGVRGNVTISDTYRSYQTYGQDINYASNAGTDNVKAWPKLNS